MRLAITASMWLMIAGCESRVRFELGNECEYASQCGPSLTCRLGRCRLECRVPRDCASGFDCIIDDGFGVCGVPSDHCDRSSDCPHGLVCVRETCVNVCEDANDCALGAQCVTLADGSRGCRESTGMECALDSDCGVPLICAPDGVCREECIGDRDCRDGTVCRKMPDTTMPNVCALPSPPGDGGGMDAASGNDAGIRSDATHDASSADARSSDSAVDAPRVDASRDAGPVAVAPSAIGLGYEHSCAVRSGVLSCWGNNSKGELGDATFTPRSSPTSVAIASAQWIASGSEHSCAASSTGLWCWGSNASGQLGVGSTTASFNSPQLLSGRVAVDLAAATAHSCALSPEGVVSCWGQNINGELGNGMTTLSRVPVDVSLPVAATQVSTRGRNSCALGSDGHVFCWGNNTFGQLGIGMTGTTPVTTPQVVVDVADAVEVAVGTSHSCARRSDGTVWCWGDNDNGQLGDGTRVDKLRPTRSGTLGNVEEIACGLDHSCARTTAGDVHCWGGNMFGEAGIDPLSSPNAMQVASPTRVLGIAGATEIAAGDEHTCARTGTDVYCWGYNSRSQLGDGTTMYRATPTRVVFP